MKFLIKLSYLYIGLFLTACPFATTPEPLPRLTIQKTQKNSYKSRVCRLSETLILNDAPAVSQGSGFIDKEGPFYPSGKYEYSKNGQLIRAGKNHYEYDEDGFLIRATNPEYTTTYKYDQNGLLKEENRVPFIPVFWEYDRFEYKNGLLTGGYSKYKDIPEFQRFEANPIGQVTKVIISISADPALRRVYYLLSYDNRGNLTSVLLERNNPSGPPNQVFEYTYDNHPNPYYIHAFKGQPGFVYDGVNAFVPTPNNVVSFSRKLSTGDEIAKATTQYYYESSGFPGRSISVLLSGENSAAIEVNYAYDGCN